MTGPPGHGLTRTTKTALPFSRAIASSFPHHFELQPGRREHDQQRLAAPQLLIEPLLPVHARRYPVGRIEVEKQLLVALLRRASP